MRPLSRGARYARLEGPATPDRSRVDVGDRVSVVATHRSLQEWSYDKFH